jgi:hypothetical protein
VLCNVRFAIAMDELNNDYTSSKKLNSERGELMRKICLSAFAASIRIYLIQGETRHLKQQVKSKESLKLEAVADEI